MASICIRLTKFVPDITDLNSVYSFISSLPITNEQKYALLYEHEVCSEIPIDPEIKSKYGL